MVCPVICSYGPAAVGKQPVQPVQPGKKSATLTPSNFTGIFPLQLPFPIRFYIKKRSPHKFMSNALFNSFSCGSGFQPQASSEVYGSLYGSLYGSRYGLRCGLRCGLPYVLPCGLPCGLLYALLDGLLHSLLRDLLYGLL